MSEISDAIQSKCLAFGDRIIKLNDFLLEQASQREEVRSKKEKSGRIPIQLLSVANLCNQLLRSGTSIGANDAEACNAISKADFKSKSYIALKEARESLYWIDLLHRNSYLNDARWRGITSSIIHQTSSILYTSYISKHILHQPSDILHLNSLAS